MHCKFSILKLCLKDSIVCISSFVLQTVILGLKPDSKQVGGGRREEGDTGSTVISMYNCSYILILIQFHILKYVDCY